MIEGQNPRDQLLVIQVPNARDQSAFYAVHSLVVDVQMLATYMPRMHNNNLEIRIAGSVLVARKKCLFPNFFFSSG